MLASLPRLLPALIAAALLGGVVACGGGSTGTTQRPTAGSIATPMAAPAAAERFLSTYVRADGAVLRTNEAGDVVSEGQAYGLLLAEVAGRDDLVRTIWGWSRAHLQRPDALLSWHADASGKVLDDGSASDADILAAYALLRYDGPQPASLHRDGKRLAQAVLDHESASDGEAPVPLGGPWAVGQRRPRVDPSYWMPGVFTRLAELTGDQRWSGSATATVALVDHSTGTQLPPDWGLLDGDGYTATGASSGGQPQYGADAQRMPMWFAHGCSATAERIAAGWWKRLRSDPGALARATSGEVYNRQGSVVALLGAAAAAGAAGDSDAARRLRGQAAEAAQASPTYYGDAWLALSAALADGSLGC